MSRLIVLGLLLLILRLAWKNFAIQIKAQVSSLSPGDRPDPPAPRAETLVRCARCGTFVAASRALKGRGEEVFCSEACREAAPHSPFPLSPTALPPTGREGAKKQTSK